MEQARRGSHGNSKTLSIAADTLTRAAPGVPGVQLVPQVTVNLVNSPGSPVELTFDKDGSLWVTRLYGGGMLLNLPADQLQLGADAQPRFRIASDDLGAGCQREDGLFKSPEGVAVFNGQVWVANTSSATDRATSGRELLGLRVSDNALVVSTISAVPRIRMSRRGFGGLFVEDAQ